MQTLTQIADSQSRERSGHQMNSYRVLFYKDLLNSDGHSFKCLQRQIDVQSDGPSQALVLAEQLIDNARLDADCVEVVHLVSNQSEHSSDDSRAPCKHTWSRVSQL
jgi:hypothetical protein